MGLNQENPPEENGGGHAQTGGMENLIATLFLARELAHREHLRDASYSQHEALGAFYDEISGLADVIAETAQWDRDLGEIPVLVNTIEGTIIDVLRGHVEWIKANRYEAVSRDETDMQALIDDVVTLYKHTIFKLRRFTK